MLFFDMFSLRRESGSFGRTESFEDEISSVVVSGSVFDVQHPI
jgi:hypothetical protein